MQLAVLLLACIALVNTATAIPAPKTVTLGRRTPGTFEKLVHDPAYFLKKLAGMEKKPKQIREQATEETPQRVKFYPSSDKFEIKDDEVKMAADEGYHVKDTWSSDPNKRSYGGWRIIGRLGSGGFGAVMLGYDGEKFGAIKFIEKGKSPEATVLEEIKMQWKLRNIPQVVKLFEWARHKEKISKETIEFTVIVMEAANAGDLTHLISATEGKGLAPEVARDIFRQLAVGLKACHKVGVVLRDIKSDNVLLFKDKTAGKFVAKFADFGLSTLTTATDSYDGRGTVKYLAPEAIGKDPPNRAVLGNHSTPGQAAVAVTSPDKFVLEKLDVYALGVTLLEMFYATDDVRVINMPETGVRVVSGINFDEPKFKALDPTVRALLEGMLQDDPAKRFTMDDVIKSDWLKG